MRSVNEVVRYLLPLGTGHNTKKRSWKTCPEWPPDLFAVAGTLVERCACYVPAFFGNTYKNLLRYEARDCGMEWEESFEVPRKVQQKWRLLIDKFAEYAAYPIEEMTEDIEEFYKTTLFLMVSADEACRNVGFVDWDEDRNKKRVGHLDFGWVYLQEFDQYRKNCDISKRYLRYLPRSLCARVPESHVCVQPKGIAPIAGCSLSRFCNHLSLLSSPHAVQTNWYPSAIWREPGEANRKTINILIIPFPYHIDGSSFHQLNHGEGPSGLESGTFATSSDWLYKPKEGAALEPPDKISVDDLAAFFEALVNDAKREVERVHAIVLPECALDEELAEGVVEKLHEKTRLALFITGFENHGENPTNGVYLYLMSNKFEHRYRLEQAKHHPWYADEQQIKRYNLGSALSIATKQWWESMSLGMRKVHFVGLDHNVCASVLICEDLARIEPAQQTLRAVGPNLVVGLLMDGPQLKDRWSARYATVLADEPGSSVLTLTCVGLVKRSLPAHNNSDYAIGLWKEFGGSVQELRLPRSAHGLVLSLSMVCETVYTPDGRKDTTYLEEPGTTRLRLASVCAVTAPKPPKWLRYE